MWHKKIATHRLFLYCIIGLILGLVLGIFLELSQVVLVSFFIFGITAIYKKEILAPFLILGFAIFGAIYSFYFKINIEKTRQEIFSYNQPVIIYGQIIEDPQETENSQKFIVLTKEINNRPIKTKLLLYFSKERKFYKKEEIKIRGTIEEAPVFGEFNYKEYLFRQGVLGVLYYPEILEIKNSNFFWRIIAKIKDKEEKIFLEALPYPENTLAKAIILGKKQELPQTIKEIFNKSGIRHITAISGMHITILISVLMSFFIALGLWRQQAGWLAIFFIFLYVVFIGFQPSALRAAIMGTGLILAQIFGRLPDAIHFLLLAAAIMLLFNPFLIYNIGFQLSFLAAAGINYLTPFLNSKLLKKVPNTAGLRNILAMTFAAQIFTLPLVLYHFGYFSFASFLANILIVPLMPIFIGLGILALILGLISFWLSFVVFLPLFLVARYIILIAGFFAKFSVLTLNLRISLVLVIIYYLILFFALFFLLKKLHQGTVP